MNRDVLAPLIAGLALGLLMGKTPGVAASADPAKGKAVYEKRCLVCHGPQGKGDGPAGRMLKPPAADFTNAETKKKSKADLMQIVENGKPWHGHGSMEGSALSSRGERPHGICADVDELATSIGTEKGCDGVSYL